MQSTDFIHLFYISHNKNPHKHPTLHNPPNNSKPKTKPHINQTPHYQLRAFQLNSKIN